MGRPAKETVDYFPHYVKSGRTIFILESKFGNDGYAFWFKLLEVLGESEGHYYDCSISNNWEYLLARTRCSEDVTEGIIDTLLSLGKIDRKLWQDKRIIWCHNFVENLSGLYRMRRMETPTPPSFDDEKHEGVGVSIRISPKGSEFPREETTRVSPLAEDDAFLKSEFPHIETPRGKGLCIQKPQGVGVSMEKTPIGRSFYGENYSYLGFSELENQDKKEKEEKKEKNQKKEDKKEKEGTSPKKEMQKEKSSVEANKNDRAKASEEIFRYFNEMMAHKAIPPIARMTEKRKGMISARMREGYNLEAILSMIKRASESDFLNGINSRNWIANFDWLFLPNNFPKVHEGNYDNRTKDNERSDSRGESQAQAADGNNRFTSTEVPKDYSERF